MKYLKYIKYLKVVGERIIMVRLKNNEKYFIKGKITNRKLKDIIEHKNQLCLI